jgi:predicted PurR-regulated permease PerM
MGLGELLGLLLAVPVASCIKTFFDAWAQQQGFQLPER